MDAQAVLLGRLTRILAREPGRALPDRMCSAFTEILGVDGTAMTLGFSASDRTVIGLSDDLAERIENIQDVVRQGPSLDAYRTSGAISLASPATQPDRWPLFLEALRSRGPVPAIYSYVMMPASTVLGVITSHVDPTRVPAVDAHDAGFLANAVGVAILGDLRSDDVDDERWAVRDRISQATGMVVAQLRVTPADALAVLRAHAFAEDVTLADVSQLVVDRSLRFGGVR
jgi:hypothetical protein